MITTSSTQRYCILGAGSSGLTVAKNFQAAGIPFDVLEKNAEIGGIWNYGSPGSSVYRSTHLISSKRLTEYTDFPMPKDYPDYPSHEQACEYLRSYARNFQLHDHIQFNCAVQRIEPTDDGLDWDVTLADGPPRRYCGVVIANGHNWDPNIPELPGEFTGRTLHSARYKTPDVLQGQRVLVIGAGNSGCDLAVEAAQNAKRTFHSTRRGYHYLPKYFRGQPIDKCGERLLQLGFPLWLRRAISRLVVHLVLGQPERFRLPKPDHKLFETHPIINSQLYYYLGHGDIVPKVDVARLDGKLVEFKDGSREEIDLIIFATGFNISFPFIDRQYLNWNAGRPDLFLNVFHPNRENIFIAGMIQPDSGQWGLVDYQAQLIARVIQLQQKGPNAADRFRKLRDRETPDLSAGIQYVHSPRHLLEVEHFSYRRRLQKMIATLS